MPRSLSFSIFFLTVCLLALATPSHAQDATWPQFRGPKGTGIALGEHRLPTQISPKTNITWQASITPGVSSPVVAGNRIFLTGVKEDNKLVTFAVSLKDGSLLWEREAEAQTLEKTDKKPRGRLATPSAATDGKYVVSFFGSSGLLGYTVEGKLAWHRKMGPFENRRGASSSPVIEDGKVILCQDHEVGSFIEAFDIATGKTIWRTERNLFNRSYGTPLIVRTNDSAKQIIAVGSGLVTSYDFESGKVNWFIKGTSAVTNPMAVLANEHLVIASANPGPKREFQPDFEQLVKARDKNGNGKLEASEIPSGLFTAFSQKYDENKNAQLNASEYKTIQAFMGSCTNGMIAFKLQSSTVQTKLNRTADITWSVKRSTPRTATPLYHDGTIYMIKDGGVFTSLNSATGEVIKTERIPANGKFFSSPVLGDGKFYIADDRGKLLVISAKPQWKVLHQASFGEPIYPTPAIVEDKLLVRTETKLYCFQTK